MSAILSFCQRALLAFPLIVLSSKIACADTADQQFKTLLVSGSCISFLLCAGLFVYFLMKGLNYRRMRLASAQWPETSGTILLSEVVQRSLVSEYGAVSPTYFPTVRYSYQVNGQTLEGNVIQPGLDDIGFLTDDLARTRLERYRSGNSITVHYDPASPTTAVLEVGQRKFAAGVAFFRAAIFLGLAAGAFALSLWALALETS